jgi:hypothetical protein
MATTKLSSEVSRSSDCPIATLHHNPTPIGQTLTRSKVRGPIGFWELRLNAFQQGQKNSGKSSVPIDGPV